MHILNIAVCRSVIQVVLLSGMREGTIGQPTADVEVGAGLVHICMLTNVGT